MLTLRDAARHLVDELDKLPARDVPASLATAQLGVISALKRSEDPRSPAALQRRVVECAAAHVNAYADDDRENVVHTFSALTKALEAC